jgi:uncharacterized membrane protein
MSWAQWIGNWNGSIGGMDVSLGVQQLTAVAGRAFSAAANHPMPSDQALDSLSSLFGHY